MFICLSYLTTPEFEQCIVEFLRNASYLIGRVFAREFHMLWEKFACPEIRMVQVDGR